MEIKPSYTCPHPHTHSLLPVDDKKENLFSKPNALPNKTSPSNIFCLQNLSIKTAKKKQNSEKGELLL